MNKTELAILMCPKRFGLMTERERAFWISRAEIAIGALERKNSFRRSSGSAPLLAQLRQSLSEQFRSCLGRPKRGRALNPTGPARKAVVRLHPLPEGAPRPLASIIGAAVAGAVRDCVNAHPMGLSRHQRGLLIGSIRKRAVNQLVCREGVVRLRAALEQEDRDG